MRLKTNDIILGRKLRSLEATIKDRTANGESSYMQQHEYDNVVKALRSVPGQAVRTDFNILHCTGEKPEVSLKIE